MAHHGGQLPEEMRREAIEQGLGATGFFPQGKFNDADEGEIRVAVSAVRGRVVINFGKSVSFVAMTGQEASDLAEALTKHGLIARGIT